MHLSVSVIIPTRGRPQLLERCLESVCRQSLPAERYEVIVVDDGPAAETQAVVERCAAQAATRKLSVRYLPSPGPHGPAAARNRGWRLAQGEIVAFTDDDTQPDTAWLEAGLCTFRPETDAVTGRIVMPLPAAPTDYELDASGLARGEFVTANCFCRRAVLERLGGFDERFSLAWREDSDLHFRLLQIGAKMVHAPGAVVVHPIRSAPWGVSLRQQKKVMFDVLLYRQHRFFYRRRIRREPRWDYHIATGALLATPAALALGAPGAALAAGAVWIAITGALSVKRLRHTSRRLGHVTEMVVTSALIPPVAVFWRIAGAIRYRTWLV
ncbi:MAG: glycosyltransferase family 2 protein [Betaproteobacteria bacterium]